MTELYPEPQEPSPEIRRNRRVVSLASVYDLQSVIDRDGCPDLDWQRRLPFDSAPFHSTLALVVRKGNPKQIRNWADLWRRDIKLALPSPSHSGAGRWAFLALQTESNDLAQLPTSGAQKLQQIFLRSTPLDAGARTALSLFANRLDLDAFLTWESDALQLADLGFSQLEAIHFPRSILASHRPPAMLHLSATKPIPMCTVLADTDSPIS